MIEGAKRSVLSASTLRFSAYELGEGPLVLCCHGFPDSPGTFRLMAPALAQAGYRVVAVTLRGYEASSQPADGDYSLAALAEDVRAWIDALGAERAHLIGHDWGANITYAAAALCPDRVDKIVTMAVPHPAAFATVLLADHDQMRRSWYIFLFQLRGLAEQIAGADGLALLKRLWSDWSPSFHDAKGKDDMVRLLSQPGALSAALDYYRAAFDFTHKRAADTQRLLAMPIRAPTLGLCGADDGCISADVFEAAMPESLFPSGRRIIRMKGAGHFLHLERPDAVHADILAHLRGG